MFLCEFCEISKHTFSYRTLLGDCFCKRYYEGPNYCRQKFSRHETPKVYCQSFIRLLSGVDFKAEEYLELSGTSTMKFFCEDNSYRKDMQVIHQAWKPAVFYGLSMPNAITRQYQKCNYNPVELLIWSFFMKIVNG